MNEFKVVKEIDFQNFFKDKKFTHNHIRNATQFLIGNEIVGLVFFNNLIIKNTKFMLKV